SDDSPSRAMGQSIHNNNERSRLQRRTVNVRTGNDAIRHLCSALRKRNQTVFVSLAGVAWTSEPGLGQTILYFHLAPARTRFLLKSFCRCTRARLRFGRKTGSLHGCVYHGHRHVYLSKVMKTRPTNFSFPRLLQSNDLWPSVTVHVSPNPL